MATLTVYPTAGVGGTTGDAWFDNFNDAGTPTWAQMRAGTNAVLEVDNTSANTSIVEFGGNATTWRRIIRSGFTFDTSALGAGATITSATFSIYGTAKVDNLTITPNVNIYGWTPSVDYNFPASDFAIANWGSTAFCDTAITYTGWSTAGYNDFALNAAGLAAISLTGITKIACRNVNYDITGTEPSLAANSSSLSGYYSDQTGTTNDPKLVITYTPGGTDYDLICEVGSFILTGISVVLERIGLWTNQAKSTSISPTNSTKNAISPTNSTKNNSTFTNQDKT